MNLKYFDNYVEYPQDKCDNILPYNEFWAYIGSTFLNGFINLVKPVSCFVLQRYKPNEKITVELTDKGQFNWHKVNVSREELINIVKSGEKDFFHTNLSMFRDDMVILGEIKENKYMFFWFDMDCSDCCIGRFETEDTIDVVKEEVIKYLNFLKEDKLIDGYDELPTSFMKGWMSF
jgi:hypothetical protein